VEKSTLRGTDGKLNAVSTTPAVPAIAVPADAVPATVEPIVEGAVCAIDDPDCEACQ
jgi:ribonucleoside-diphosphate reductase alpha chain